MFGTRRLCGLLSTAALLLAVGWASRTAVGGPIFLPGHLEDGAYVAPEERAVEESDADEPAAERRGGTDRQASDGFGYEIRYATIDARVDEAGAVAVEAEETIAGPQDGVRTVCLVPLPHGVEGDSVRFSAGPTSRQRAPLEGVRFLDAKAARPFLERLVKATGDVGFAALTGRPIAVLDGFELARRTSFHVAYRERVRRDKPAENGVARLVVPLPRTQWATAPVRQLSIRTTIERPEPIRAVFSPTHETETERDSLFALAARVRATDVRCEEDYQLLWVEDEDDLGLRVLPFRLEGEEDGYFMLVGNPTGRADGRDVLHEDVTFVLDTSGSMRGEKIEQCRAAIEYCLSRLGERDRFNVVTFGTEVRSFRPGVVENTAENVASAWDFVDGIVARGRTNIGGALQAALAGESTPGRPRITIFLTDGTPTAGERVPEKILEAAQEANASKSSVYVLGVGHDVNVHLLDRLAEATDGAAEFVEPDEEIDVKVAGLYDRLAHPVLTDVSVDFGELDTHAIFPRKLPALYRNTQVMLFGRYRGGGRHTVTLAGTLAGEDRRYAVDFEAPAEAHEKGNAFVPPLWAARKIGFLLQEMRLHGEDPELLQEVVRLSRKYGIVTEYTQFVATRTGVIRGGRSRGGFAFGAQQGQVAGKRASGPLLGRPGLARNALNAPAPADGAGAGAVFEELDEAEAVREVQRQLAVARKQETGRWAFNQARNDKDLQSRVVTTGKANAYRDRRGQKVDVGRFVKHVGGRCFYFKNGQWCEAEEAGDRKERVVQLYSDEYFRLLRSDEDFRRAQKLGWAISINVGNERVVVEKDGQRSDLPERPQPEEQQLRQQSPQDEGAALQRGNVDRARPLQPNRLQNVEPRLQRAIEQRGPNRGQQR